MLDLDSAIKHCEEKAQYQRKKAKLLSKRSQWKVDEEECLECAKEHEQLAEWLKELKHYRNLINKL